MAAVRMDLTGQESRPQGGSMTWGLVELLNSESQIKVKGDGWVALERMQIMGMRSEHRSHWETQEDPWSWLLWLSLFPSLWILGPILPLPTQLLYILLSTHWLSCPSITSAFLSQPWPPALPLLSDPEAHCLPLHTSERKLLTDPAFLDCYVTRSWLARQPMAGLVLAQMPNPCPISCGLAVREDGLGPESGSHDKNQSPGAAGRALE